MALFKINRGNSASLPVTMTDGWAYFCTDTAEFFIDYADGEGILHRKKINTDELANLNATDAELYELINANTIAISTLDTIVASKASQTDLDVAVARIAANEVSLASLVEISEADINAVFG